MRLVYLVKEKPSPSAVLLADGSVSCSVTQFGNPSQDLWLLAYSTKKNGFDEARALASISSDFDGLGIEHLLLDDGASAYYERRLFGQIADFERKLRAALSMRVALIDGDLNNKLVEDLEKIDFGKLFERFFVDDAFVVASRDILKKGNSRYEKADLLAKIAALPESGEWDRLFNDDEAPMVKSSHGLVHGIRNDVMHAHRMTTEAYLKAKATLSACNAELGALLEDLPGEGEQPSGFNEALSNVLGELSSEPTWDDLAGATRAGLASKANWADFSNVIMRITSMAARGYAAEEIAADPELERAVRRLSGSYGV